MLKKRKHEQDLTYDTEQLIQAALMRKKRKHKQDKKWRIRSRYVQTLYGNHELPLELNFLLHLHLKFRFRCNTMRI